MPETKLKQFASSDEEMAAQIVSTDKGLQVRLRKLPKYNQLGQSIWDARHKLIKRKKGPGWTEYDDDRFAEIVDKMHNDEDLDLSSVLDK